MLQFQIYGKRLAAIICYHDIWDAASGAVQTGGSYLHDIFAVAVVQNVIIVSHSLQKISAVSALFEDCGTS